MLILHTVYEWWQTKQWGPINLSLLNDTKPHKDIWTPAEIQRLEKRVEQLEREARNRSFTPSETVARWTTYSDGETLSEY